MDVGDADENGNYIINVFPVNPENGIKFIASYNDKKYSNSLNIHNDLERKAEH